MASMHAGWKTKWIRALVSGKYRQTTGRLYITKKEYKGRSKGYCCLGVLARIQGVKWEHAEDGYTNSMKPVGNDQMAYLDAKFSCGLSQEDQSVLASMNDDKKSFKEIAAWIKKNVKTVRVSKKKK